MSVRLSEGERISAHVSHANVSHRHTGAPLGYFYVHLYFHPTFVHLSLSPTLLTTCHNTVLLSPLKGECLTEKTGFRSASLSVPAQASRPGTEAEEEASPRG